MGPARMIAESLTPKPGIREQYRHEMDVLGVPRKAAKALGLDVSDKLLALANEVIE